MVKFQVYSIKKRYKRHQIYSYKGILLRVPKRFHDKILPIINETFEMKNVNIEETAGQKTVSIVLLHKKLTVNKSMEQMG